MPPVPLLLAGISISRRLLEPEREGRASMRKKTSLGDYTPREVAVSTRLWHSWTIAERTKNFWWRATYYVTPPGLLTVARTLEESVPFALGVARGRPSTPLAHLYPLFPRRVSKYSSSLASLHSRPILALRRSFLISEGLFIIQRHVHFGIPFTEKKIHRWDDRDHYPL